MNGENQVLKQSPDGRLTLVNLLQEFNEQNVILSENFISIKHIDGLLEQLPDEKETDSEQLGEPNSLIEKLQRSVGTLRALNIVTRKHIDSILHKIE